MCACIFVYPPPQAGGWRSIRSGVTNDDGRVANLLTPSESLYPGVYRMLFHTGDYFDNVRKVAHFYPSAAVVFKTTDRSYTTIHYIHACMLHFTSFILTPL